MAENDRLTPFRMTNQVGINHLGGQTKLNLQIQPRQVSPNYLLLFMQLVVCSQYFNNL